MPPRTRGDYAHKITGVRLPATHQLILTGAIDLHFWPGWLEVAEKLLDEQVRVVGTNDLTNERTEHEHSTHTLVARDYVEQGLIDGRPGCVRGLPARVRGRRAGGHRPQARGLRTCSRRGRGASAPDGREGRLGCDLPADAHPDAR